MRASDLALQMLMLMMLMLALVVVLLDHQLLRGWRHSIQFSSGIFCLGHSPLPPLPFTLLGAIPFSFSLSAFPLDD